jgi:hypothetical protein
MAVLPTIELHLQTLAFSSKTLNDARSEFSNHIRYASAVFAEFVPNRINSSGVSVGSEYKANTTYHHDYRCSVFPVTVPNRVSQIVEVTAASLRYSGSTWSIVEIGRRQP